MIHYKNSSVLRQDPKGCLESHGIPPSLPLGIHKILKQWCLDMFDKYNDDKKEGRKDTSFSTAQADEAMADPSSNTKMIV